MEEELRFKSTEDYQLYQEEREVLMSRCNAINLGIENLDENSGARAIWELVQNARDCGNGACDIKIKLLSDKLIFLHRGEPFCFKSLLDLVMQSSSKDDPKADMVGRYGTGFMTTHAINEIVKVSGPYKVVKYASNCQEGYEGYIYIDDFEINRSLRHDKIAAMNEMREEKKRVKNLYTEKPFYASLNELREEQHWTKFVYGVDAEKREMVSSWLAFAMRLMPFVMTINPSIKCVELNDEFAKSHMRIYRKDRSEMGYLRKGGRWKIVNDIIEIEEECEQKKKQIDIHSLQAESDGRLEDVVIIPPYPDTCGKVEDIPSLFMGFPLLGTEHFGVNFIFHSMRFHPVEKRNNIMLPREIPSDTEREKQNDNESVLVEMMNALFDYYVINGNDSLLTRSMCEVAFPTNGEDKTTDAFYERMQKLWAERIKQWHVIPTIEGKKALLDKYVKVLHPDFYKRLSLEKRIEYEPVLCKYANMTNTENGDAYLLPSETLIDWSETVAKWGNSISGFYLTIEDVCKAIEGNNNDLIKFLRFLQDSENTLALDTYALFPNRKGALCRKGPMTHAAYLDKNGYMLVEQLIGEDAEKIIDTTFVEIAGAGEYTKDALHKAISGTISVWRNQHLNREQETAMPQGKVEALLRFCSATSQAEFKSARGRLMPYICAIHAFGFEQQSLPKMKEVEEDFYKSAFNLLVDYTLYVVSRKDKDWIRENRGLLLHFLQEFGTSSGEEWLSKLDNYAVLPNQNGQLRLYKDLHRNEGIPPLMVNIYKEVKGIELYDVWIDETCKDWYSFTKDTPDAIAKQIQDELHEELMAQQAKEHKDIFKTIILKLGEDEQWRQWFYEVEERKQAILFDMQSGSVQKSLFELMELPEQQLTELARLSEENLMNKMLTSFAQQQLAEQEAAARKEHLLKIGKHVEEALQNEITEYNLDIYYPGKEKLVAEDKQDGQDIEIRQIVDGKEEPIFYIEVKSKWDFNEAAHMSTNQIIKACKNKDRYALCCVDLRPYKNEDLANIAEDIIVQQTRVKMDIGIELDLMMHKVIEANEKSDNVQIKIADYRSNIGAEVFVQGKPFNALLERIREIARKREFIMRYKTVEEMCSDEGKVVYHFFPAYLKDMILQDGLLISMDRCRKGNVKRGIYVVWSDDARVQTAIAWSQVSVDRFGNYVDKLCRIKINLKKYGITAKDIAPDLNGENDCDLNSFCCKIVKDIKNIDPKDVEEWNDLNGDTTNIEYYNLDGYNIEHKPADYELNSQRGLYPKRGWKKYE